MSVALAFVAILCGGCFAEWVHVPSTPLRKVSWSNDTGSTRLFQVGFDYADEFSCARVHNLTMSSYARGDDPPPADGGNYLKKLERRLNRQIEDRIRSLGRGARTYHIGFPSLEGALVSISLLLFAVYLIKLVMKLIYTFNFKRGTTEYVGFLSNLRQPIVIAPNRQRRDADIDMESLRLRALFEDQSRLFN